MMAMEIPSKKSFHVALLMIDQMVLVQKKEILEGLSVVESVMRSQGEAAVSQTDNANINRTQSFSRHFFQK